MVETARRLDGSFLGGNPMKKHVQKILCGLLCIITAYSLVGCKGGAGTSESSSGTSVGSSYENSQEESSESSFDGSSEEYNSDSETFDDGSSEDSNVAVPESSGDDPDGIEENSDSSVEDPDSSVEDPDVDPPNQGGGEKPSDPSPEKTLAKEEVDSLGHKIAYYTDGSWEDLGRVIPLDFSVKAAASRYGYQQIRKEENAAGKQNFYNELFQGTLTFSQSGGDVASETIAGGVCYPIAKIDCGGYGISYEDQQEVLRTFKQDCPEFYFLSTQFCVSGDEFWLCIDEEYAKAADRAALHTAIENAVLECDQYLNGKMSETELALTLHDYLTANVTYSYQADGVTPAEDVWAHNLVGWATRKSGVCETYAESYAYLCGLFGLECWTVTGKDLQTGVGHAWNILQLGGVWYNVDVTWDDGFEKTAPKLLDRQWFGMGAAEFAVRHSADLPTGVGTQYQVPLPTLSENTLHPVRLKENDGDGVMLPSIDTAIENMKNEGSRYEIILYPDTNAQVKADKVIYPQGASFTKTELPKTAGVTISARRYYTSKTTYIPAHLNAPTAVDLKGDVTLKDLTWTGDTINVLSGRLILGDGVDVQAAVTGITIVIDAGTGYAVLSGAVAVEQMDVVSGTARAYNAVHLQLLQVSKNASLYHLTAEHLAVDGIISEENAMLYMTDKTSSSIVSIGGIMASAPFKIYVSFVGVNGYPTLQLKGSIKGSVNLVLDGKVSGSDSTSITSSMMTMPFANVAAAVNTDALRVYFVQGDTAHEKTFVKDSSGNLTANE